MKIKFAWFAEVHSYLQGWALDCCIWWRESGVEQGRSWLRRRPCGGRTRMKKGRPAALRTPCLSNTIKRTRRSMRRNKNCHCFCRDLGDNNQVFLRLCILHINTDESTRALIRASSSRFVVRLLVQIIVQGFP